ncbi:MAG: cation:proton antiporter [Spirochaetaceae bacterium]|nr:MAG: cation:proton antiporter [Spirochaetaceae bacterium]
MSLFIGILVVFLALAAVRLVIGPTTEDRLLGLTMVSAHIVLILAMLAVEFGNSFYLDAAMIYALLSFTEVIAYVRFSGSGG